MKKLHDVIKALPASAENQTVNANHAEEKLEEAEDLLESRRKPAGRRGNDDGPDDGR